MQKNLMNVDQLKLYKTKLSQHFEYIETVPLSFTVYSYIDLISVVSFIYINKRNVYLVF